MSESRNSYLKRNYGLSAEDYELEAEAQRYVCKICGRPNLSKTGEERPLVVDHRHTGTGDFRGLLCDPCNKGLGHFRDSIDLLLKAAAYLRESDGQRLVHAPSSDFSSHCEQVGGPKVDVTVPWGR